MREQRCRRAFPRSYNKAVAKPRPEPRAPGFYSTTFSSVKTYINKREDATGQIMDKTSNDLLLAPVQIILSRPCSISLLLWVLTASGSLLPPPLDNHSCLETPVPALLVGAASPRLYLVLCWQMFNSYLFVTGERGAPDCAFATFCGVNTPTMADFTPTNMTSVNVEF